MSDTPTENDTNIENKTATVSIRKMSLKVWYRAGYHCKLNDITLQEYITELIRNDIEKRYGSNE